MCSFVGPTLVSASVDCGRDKAFSPATGQCSLTLKHSVCQQKQFVCENAGDANVWPLSPNIFYICKATSNQDERVLYPTLYRCDDGEIFDGYFCRPANDNDSNQNPSITTTPPATATSIAPVFPSICGQAGLFANPTDCHKYFYCSAISGILRHMECPMGTYFNQAISSCTFGNC